MLSENSASAVVKSLYNIDSQDVPVVYSDEGLYFWEAGCFWTENDARWIQLKKHFENRDRLYGIYQKNEVLAHEYVHAARADLESKKYEEHFAYYTSISFAKGNPSAYLRAYLGPLFSNSNEAKYLLLTFLAPGLLLNFDLPFLEALFCVPLVVSSFFVLRLAFRWRRWFLCKKKVGLKRMVQLKDEEIDALVRAS